MTKRKRPGPPTADDAYRAGADACYAGRDVTDCPYDADEVLASEWRAGWLRVFNAQLAVKIGARPPRS